MNRLALSPILALAACSGGTADETAQPEEPEAPAAQAFESIPEGFRGHWEFAREDCAAEASEGRLEVGADALDYYESRGEAVSVNGTPTAVTVVAGFSGEGESWQETLALTLDDDGRRLTVETPDGNLSIRMRCP